MANPEIEQVIRTSLMTQFCEMDKGIYNSENRLRNDYRRSDVSYFEDYYYKYHETNNCSSSPPGFIIHEPDDSKPVTKFLSPPDSHDEKNICSSGDAKIFVDKTKCSNCWISHLKSCAYNEQGRLKKKSQRNQGCLQKRIPCRYRQKKESRQKRLVEKEGKFETKVFKYDEKVSLHCFLYSFLLVVKIVINPHNFFNHGFWFWSIHTYH